MERYDDWRAAVKGALLAHMKVDEATLWRLFVAKYTPKEAARDVKLCQDCRFHVYGCLPGHC